MTTRSRLTEHDAMETLDFDALYRDRWLPMVRLAALLLGDVPSAEDAVQDAFVNVYRKRWRLADQASGSGYLRVAVVNSCRSRHRRRKAAALALARLGMPDEGDDDGTGGGPAKDILDALQALPRRQREVIVLRYWTDLSESDTARILSVSVGAVKSSASRGLAALRTSLGEPDER
jgi:RNA polymerase sigma-70 factor (sigma-E family)